MAQEITDVGSAQRAGSDSSHAVATALSQQVNLMEQLHLKDPAKQTTADLLQNQWLHVTPLDPHSAMNDPHKFLTTASEMTEHAPGGNLSRDLLQQTLESPTASNDQKNAAKTLSEQYFNIATDDPHSLKRFTKYFGFDTALVIREDGLSELKQEQYAADAYAKHPELKGPQSLAYAFKNIFETQDIAKREFGLTTQDLITIAASSKYTDQERAAAEFVKLNFSKFATLGDKDGQAFSIHDVVGLAKIGLPPGVQFPACEKSDAAANAIGSAVVVGLVSKALGSKQSVSNAMVAGASAAIATEVTNKVNCGDN